MSENEMLPVSGKKYLLTKLIALISIVLLFPAGSFAQSGQRSVGSDGARFPISDFRPELEQDQLEKIKEGKVSPYPKIQVVEPVDGSVVHTLNPGINIVFNDQTAGLDLRSLQVIINGVDRTSLFHITSSSATYEGPSVSEEERISSRLPDDIKGRLSPDRISGMSDSEIFNEGHNLIVAIIKNKAGFSATASTTFIVDTQVWSDVERSRVERSFVLPPDETLSSRPSLPLDVTRDLKQFGYGHFNAPSSTFAPVTDATVPGDYIIGPGDQLLVYIWGSVEDQHTVQVNNEGRIFLPRIGNLTVWGMTYSEVQDFIKGQVLRFFEGVDVRVTLGGLRSINVSVIGEVSKPGRYTLGSLSTVSNAIYVAGGPTKLGSLRKIKLSRDGEQVGTIDLYDFLLSGDRSDDYKLRSGDTVFVPAIGATVAISGQVKRPGIYEIKESTELEDLIQMAGGVLPQASLKRVQVERVDEGGGKSLIDVDISGTDSGKQELTLKNGDFVKVFKGNSRIQNTVTLEGFVEEPGKYEFRPGMLLTELLTPDAVLPEAHVEDIELVRTELPGLAQKIIQVNIRHMWDGIEEPLVLQPMDRVVVNSSYREPEFVELEGEIKRPGRYYIERGERLSSVIKRAGGFTDDAYLKGAVFTREEVREEQREELNKFIKSQEEALIQESSRLSAGALELTGSDRVDASLAQQALQQKRELLRVISSKVTLGRVVIKLDEIEEFEGSEQDITLEDGDVLTVPEQPGSLLVLGSVRNPTAITYKKGQDVEYYINRAGGFTKEADKDEMYISKADGSAVSAFVKLRKVEPGDVIVVPPKVEPKLRKLPALRDIATSVGQFALTLGVFITAF